MLLMFHNSKIFMSEVLNIFLNYRISIKEVKRYIITSVLNLIKFVKLQSNSVITNSSGPAIFVRYNQGSL
jgi:hypothetical protein